MSQTYRDIADMPLKARRLWKSIDDEVEFFYELTAVKATAAWDKKDKRVQGSQRKKNRQSLSYWRSNTWQFTRPAHIYIY
jgi:hypothetical protein